MGNWGKIIKNLSLISQLAISVLVPSVGMFLIAHYLQNKFGLGSWIIIVAVLLGVPRGFISAWNFLKPALHDAKKQSQDYKNRFK
jgi:positive regulator of sigma E activity